MDIQASELIIPSELEGATCWDNMNVTCTCTCTAQTRDHDGTRVYVPHMKVYCGVSLCVCHCAYYCMWHLHVLLCLLLFVIVCCCIRSYVSSCVLLYVSLCPTACICHHDIIMCHLVCVTVYCYTCVTCESGISVEINSSWSVAGCVLTPFHTGALMLV